MVRSGPASMQAVIVFLSGVAVAATIAGANAQPKDASRFAKPGETAWGSLMAIERNDGWSTRGVWLRDSSNEEPEIARFKDRATRDDNILRLKLDDNRVLKIADEGRCGGFGTCLVHRLVDWWPRLHYYVVRVSHGEGDEAYLIRENDGFVVRVPAPPILSPDNRYAVASNPTVENGGGKAEVLDMRPDPPEILAFKDGPTCPKAADIITLGSELKWIDNTRIVFSNVQLAGGTTKSLTWRIIDGRVEVGCLL